MEKLEREKKEKERREKELGAEIRRYICRAQGVGFGVRNERREKLLSAVIRGVMFPLPQRCICYEYVIDFAIAG